MRAGDGPAIELRVLGPFEVLLEGGVVALGSPKQRALLAALVISANRVVSVDRLVEELWGDEAPARAMASLQAYISRLRRLLQPEGANRGRSDILVTQPPGYVLRVDPESLDAVGFEHHAAEGSRRLAEGDAPGALAALDEAFGLWRGSPYAEFSFEQFAQAEIARLEELRLAATEVRLEALLETGQAVTAVADAEAVVRDHPLREGVWASLMTGLYRAGRQGDALRAYQRARQAIGEELGIEPGRVLQELEGKILHQSVDLEPAPRRQPSAGLPPGPDAAPVGPVPPAEEPLVGRAAELRQIAEAVTGAVAGRGRAVLLHGEPGIGKTRLAREAARQAAAAGARVGHGGCLEGHGTAAYWPWTLALRGLVEGVEPEDLPPAVREALAELAPIDPALARRAGEVTVAGAPADPDLARSRLQRAAVDAVVGLARLSPVVVVLEDMQWGDPSSLQLLSLAAPELAGVPVLIVVTYRDQEYGPGLAATLGTLDRLTDTVDLPLAGLDAGSVHRFVELAAGRDVSGEVAASIASRTAGNPLFVGELTRLLRSEGTLHEEAVRRAPVPVGVREVIRRRLDRLPAQTTTVLTVAAVIGRRFPLTLLGAVTELPQDELLDRVESALAVGLVVEGDTPVGTFAFTHDLVRDTLQDAVSGTRRARLHARIAHALLEDGDDRDPARVFSVADHLHQALPLVPAEEVAQHVLRAADTAAGHLAFEQAEDELQRALALVDRLPPAVRARHELAVRVRLARVLTLTRGHATPEEREHAGRAVALAAGAEPSPDAILAMWGAGVSAGMAAEFSTTLGIGEQLVRWGEEQHDLALVCMGHELIGGCTWYLGDLDTAARHLGRAVDIIDAGAFDRRLFHDRTNGTWSRATHAVVAWLAGRDEEAAALMSDAVRRAEGPHRPFALVFALFFDAILAVLREDRPHARRRAHELVEHADAIGYRQFSELGRLLAAHAQGDPAARATGLGTVPGSAESRPRLFQPLFLALHAQAELDLGHPEPAAALLARALAAARETGERFYEPEIHRLLGVAAQQQGRPDEAAAHFRSAGEVARELGLVSFERRAAASLGAAPG